MEFNWAALGTTPGSSAATSTPRSPTTVADIVVSHDSENSTQDRSMEEGDVEQPTNYTPWRWFFGLGTMFLCFVVSMTLVVLTFGFFGASPETVLYLSILIWAAGYFLFIGKYVWHYNKGYEATVMETLTGKKWVATPGISPGYWFGDSPARAPILLNKEICEIKLGGTEKEPDGKEFTLGDKTKVVILAKIPCMPSLPYLLNLAVQDQATLEQVVSAHVVRQIQERLGHETAATIKFGSEGIDMIYQTLYSLFRGPKVQTNFEKRNGMNMPDYIVSQVKQPKIVEEGAQTTQLVVNAAKAIAAARAANPNMSQINDSEIFREAMNIEKAQRAIFWGAPTGGGGKGQKGGGRKPK